MLNYAPNEVALRCRMAVPGLLFLSDTFYPGWEVTVGGTPRRILRADYAFRAVALAGGCMMFVSGTALHRSDGRRC